MQLKQSVLLQLRHPGAQGEQLPKEAKNPEIQPMHSVDDEQLRQFVRFEHESQVFPFRKKPVVQERQSVPEELQEAQGEEQKVQLVELSQ